MLFWTFTAGAFCGVLVGVTLGFMLRGARYIAPSYPRPLATRSGALTLAQRTGGDGDAPSAATRTARLMSCSVAPSGLRPTPSSGMGERRYT